MPTLDLSAQDVFKPATIQGAKAVNMERDIGSLEEGKLANMVIFDGVTPGMLNAGQQDPIVAIVLHASIRDIDMVIVDGQIRKESGRLLPVSMSKSNQPLSWYEIADEVARHRENVQERIQKQELPADMEGLMQTYMHSFFGLDLKKIK